MNNKGFIFVETIIVITVLSTSLLMIYSAFTNLLINEKRRSLFDDTSYVYRTYFLEDFLVSLNMEDYLEKYINNPNTGRKIMKFSCDKILFNIAVDGITNNEESVKQSFCETLINAGKMNIKNIYITKYNVFDLKKCTTISGSLNSSCDTSTYENLKSLSTNMIYYIRTLAGTDDNTYRMIVEYEETEFDKLNTVSLNSDGTCPSDYHKTSNIEKTYCEKIVIKNYYNSIKMVPRKLVNS